MLDATIIQYIILEFYACRRAWVFNEKAKKKSLKEQMDRDVLKQGQRAENTNKCVWYTSKICIHVRVRMCVCVGNVSWVSV